MPRPMTRYKSENPKVEKISFQVGRFGHKFYSEYGNIKVYANKTQCDKKISELKLLGYAVIRNDYPYTIIMDEL